MFFLTGIFYVLRSLSVCGITFSRNTTLHMGSIESKHARTPYIYSLISKLNPRKRISAKLFGKLT